MDASELRALQAPLKALYRQDRASAHTPLAARGDFRDAGVTCTVDGFAGSVRAGLHAATGGDGTDACSGDMLLEAVVACAGVTARSVATAMGLALTEVTLSAVAEFDAAGTLGTDRDAEVGVTGLVVTMAVTTDADDATLARLGQTTEKYCVVGQSLKTPPRIVIERRQSG